MQNGYRHIDCASVYGNEKEVILHHFLTPCCIFFLCMPTMTLFMMDLWCFMCMCIRACCIDIAQIGVALKELFSTGVVHRSEIFITSKLWYVFVLLPDK